MAMQLRYKGEFLSIKGVLYRAEILQESDTAFEVGELTFEADEPLVIEWDDKQKHEPICSSSATLKIESPGDRTYTDLYSEEVGSVRLDIYKEDKLYWQGCLDTEFYEEPYERLDMYAVSLTFSDFGVFDRLLFNKGDVVVTLQEVLEDAITRAGLTYTSSDIEHYTSTYLPETASAYPFDLTEIAVNGSNFYDEEDEASTMQDVIEGMLQPLALKMIQRNGKIIIYDLDWAWYNAEKEQIEWSSDSQTLSVDSVYNNAKITFSPYAQTIELPDEGFVGDIDEDKMDLTKAIPTLYDGSHDEGDDVWFVSWDLFRGYLVWSERDQYDANYGQGFTLWLSRKNHFSSGGFIWPNYDYLNYDASGGLIPQSEGTFWAGLYFFKLAPFYLGDEVEGIMLRSAKAINNDGDNVQGWAQYGIDATIFTAYYNSTTGTSIVGHLTLYRSDELRIPTLADKNKVNLLVTLDVLLSAGYSPWHTDNVEISPWRWSSDSSKSNDARLKEQLQYMIVPIRLVYTTDSGKVYAWTNVNAWDDMGCPDNVNTRDTSYYTTWSESLGKWVDVTNDSSALNNTIGCLAYYPSSNLDTSAPDIIGSFGSNNQYRRGFQLTSDVIAMGAESKALGGGQMVCMPTTESGKVYIEILSSWVFLKYEGNRYNYTGYNNEIAEHIRWCLMKAPKIEMVSYRPWNTSLDTDDVEYSALLNPNAKEDIELDTICGTGGADRPTARGSFLNGSGSKVLTTFSREDLSGTCEELLIATLYSQYAQRHTTLSGEAYIQQREGFTVFTDRAQNADTLFLATEIIENLYQDCGDMKFVELSKDDYEPIEED